MGKSINAGELFNKLAGLYQQKYMDVGLYHGVLDVFCESITIEEPEILELACGPGNVTKYLLEKKPDFKILGTDIAPNMIGLAKQNNPQAEFKVLDCRKILALRKKYDAIVCSFCLPYLTKEETMQLIADASEILNPDGVFYISTMEDEYEKSGPVTGSTGEMVDMYFYTGDFLEQLLEKNGFTLLILHRQQFPTQDDTVVIDLIAIARKK